MKTFKYSLLAAVCVVAVTACSSGKDSISTYLDSEANKIQALANKKAAEESAAKKAAEAELEELRKKVAKIDAENAAIQAENARVESNIAAVKAVVTNQKSTEVKGYTYTSWDGEKTKDLTLSNVSGKQISVANNRLTENQVNPKNEDIDTLVVDGTAITLYSRDEISQWQSNPPSEYKSKELSGEFTGKVGSLAKTRFIGDFEQVRYGYVTKDGKTTLFVQGHMTPTTEKITSRFDTRYTNNLERLPELNIMPTGDKAFEYTGFAFYGKDNVYQELTVDAVADFANKKVRADLKENGSIKVTLGGVINGNTFAGEYNGATTSGAFYGDGAQNMAGTFYQSQGDNKDKHGVFGATAASEGRYSFSGKNVYNEKKLDNFEVVDVNNSSN